MDEIWKDIKGYEGLYQVSNLGNIKSLRFNKEKILKGGLSGTGYLTVNLFNYGKPKSHTIHRLVANNFLSDEKEQVNHIDGDKTNNRLTNLEFCTRIGNSEHAFVNGLSISGSEHHMSKLTENDVIQIRKSKETQKVLGEKYGVTRSLISLIKNNKCWKHIKDYE